MKKILLVIMMLLSSASLNAWKACYVEYGKLGNWYVYIQPAMKEIKAILTTEINANYANAAAIDAKVNTIYENAVTNYANDLKEIKCKPSDGKNWRAVGRQTCGGKDGGVCCCHD